MFALGLWMTGENQWDLAWERISMRRDGLAPNLAGLAAMAAAIFMLVHRTQGRWTRGTADRALTLTLVVLTAGALAWVLLSDTVPQADQRMLSEIASELNQGNAASLAPGAYAGMYTHQLGLITWLRVLFWLFGNGNFLAYQAFSALTVPLIVYCADGILREMLSGRELEAAEPVLLLLMLCFAPMVLYTPFVYGDLASVAFMLLAAWMLLKCLDRFSWRRGCALALAIAAAVLLRSSSLIFVIACSIVLLIRSMSREKGPVLRTAACLVVGVLAVQGLLKLSYAGQVSEASAMPAVLWVAMGTRETALGPGWFDGYNVIVFSESGFDRAVASRKAWHDIGIFLDRIRHDPAYVADFYLRKINTQWNVPMVQSLAMNNRFSEPPTGIVHSVYFGGLRVLLETLMNLLQLGLYGGAAAALLLRRNRKAAIQHQVLLITVFGGFLFTLLWEAKSRYVLPYLILLIPTAAIGWMELWRRGAKMLRRRRGLEQVHGGTA